jgi:aminopeptidase N
MRNQPAVTVRRADYQSPAYRIDRIDLEFDLDPAATRVTTTLVARRNAVPAGTPLILDGEQLQLNWIEIDGRRLEAGEYDMRGNQLVVATDPAQRDAAPIKVRLENTIRPEKNTELMGLYLSHGNFFTQCEAEGFRRITFFPDRPDVMATYGVTLRADRNRYPVLLANGNRVAEGVLADGRRWSRWEDPHPKPSYLFALVAGRFECLEDRLRTRSGREVLLQVWVEPGNLDKTAHAMESLKRAIRWDEQRFGLELDLERFMIVASNDFNMGAMENKGLNVFNAKYVLASPQVATDTDYANIESIVGHEYFHNWTGNRVTCRDWFQLSLKEGLTVFRDQEFSADVHPDEAGTIGGRAVKRIEAVRALRASQFPEDAGPMAHPVRPDAYQEIGNFYTATVYEKGAEVVRMLQTLLGREGFRKGLDLYFARHDGQAVTCDDFVAAMADANGRDLTQFARWYAQAGTPRVAVASEHDPVARTYELTLSQSCLPTPGQAEKLPFVIPFAVGLIAPDGRDLPLRLEGEPSAGDTTRVLELTQATQRFRFVDVPTAPVPSLLREYSAPVVVDYSYRDDELAFLAAHDSDAFNRWEAMQRMTVARLMTITDTVENGRAMEVDPLFVEVLRETLADDGLSAALREQALQFPAEAFIAEQRASVDPDAIRQSRRFLRQETGRLLASDLHSIYARLSTQAPYSPDPVAAGRRALRNLALSFLVESEDVQGIDLARRQLDTATNMTDQQAALAALINSRAPFKAEMLVRFARAWATEPLLMNKWFQLQATAVAQPGEPPVLERVRLLLKHPAYSNANPNNVYALVLAFCHHNPGEFHRPDGSGYAFWIEQVETLDRINPTVAARVARALDRWRRFTPERQRQMQDALLAVARSESLSRDVREIVTKALEN